MPVAFDDPAVSFDSAAVSFDGVTATVSGGGGGVSGKVRVHPPKVKTKRETRSLLRVLESQRQSVRQRDVEAVLAWLIVKGMR